jgi:formylglycine-generating enzyme required for sulfatase activity
MGSPVGERGRSDDEVQHLVTLTRGYWLAETACTQALWAAVTGDDPSGFKGERRPVENISWEDAQGLIERLNTELDAFVGRVASRSGTAMAVGHRSAQRTLQLRLPTEAEWEYACRAGTTGPFSFGDDIIPGQANYDSRETVDVASLPPNPWGLYEMHGNVWEWCRDWYGGYPRGQVSDPVGPDSGEGRVLRGGSWFGGARVLRSAYRGRGDPGGRTLLFGFRLALGPEPGPAGQAGTERGRTARAGSER